MTAVERLGQWGEKKAAEFLSANGYQVLERNYKNRLGEIDLIALDRKVLCFIEVKTRRSLAYGRPYESVTRRKQVKIAQVALAYLKHRFGKVDINARFDVVSIVQDNFGQIRIEHIPSAFDLSH